MRINCSCSRRAGRVLCRNVLGVRLVLKLLKAKYYEKLK